MKLKQVISFVVEYLKPVTIICSLPIIIIGAFVQDCYLYNRRKHVSITCNLKPKLF